MDKISQKSQENFHICVRRIYRQFCIMTTMSSSIHYVNNYDYNVLMYTFLCNYYYKFNVHNYDYNVLMYSFCVLAFCITKLHVTLNL